MNLIAEKYCNLHIIAGQELLQENGKFITKNRSAVRSWKEVNFMTQCLDTRTKQSTSLSLFS